MTQPINIEVKGVAVKSIREFIALKYPDIYNEWLNALPQEVQKVFSKGILMSKWFDAEKFVRIPTKLAAQMLYTDSKELSYNMGIFSSHTALKGIYKFFLRFGGPVALLKRVPFFLETYYKPANVKVLYINEIDREAKLEFDNFLAKEDLLVYRIMGWGYNTLLEAGAKDAQLSISDGANEMNFYMIIQWE